jgi:hypothetical protein
VKPPRSPGRFKQSFLKEKTVSPEAELSTAQKLSAPDAGVIVPPPKRDLGGANRGAEMDAV